MTSTALKIIAVVTMLIDHVGMAVFPQYRIFRIIGRLAFPIYCFLLTEGAVYTKNWVKYAGRLYLLAILSEVPFDLAVGRVPFYPVYQNVFWTLGTGLVIVRLWHLYDCLRGKNNGLQELALSKPEVRFLAYLQQKPQAYRIWEILLPLVCLLLTAVCDFAGTDYGGFGAVLIWLLFLAKKVDRRRQKEAVKQITFWLFSGGVVIAMCLVYGGLEKWGALAAVPIFLYNGKRGWCPKVLQYGFYAFYPLHLLAIAVYVLYL